jgi:large subunit ribosomal protein L17
MKHHDKNRKFGRKTDQRSAFLRSLMRALVLHESIETTEARAKEIRPRLEKLITRSKTDSLAARRIVSSRVHDPVVVKKLFETIAPRYKTRPGGYLRITKTGYGKSDARPLAIIEFVK